MNKPAVPVTETANKSGRKFAIPDSWKAELMPSGTLRAVHVLTPALMERTKDKESIIPVVAIRSSHGNFSRMRLVRHAELLGPSFIGEDFANPLPSTNGRAVAVLYTEYAINVWVDPAADMGVIDTTGLTPEQVMEECKKRLEALKKPAAAPAPVPARQPAPVPVQARQARPANGHVEIQPGTHVKVVKGRKVPVGTTGKVFWVGEGRHGERVGFNDGEGERYFTALTNVVAVAA